MKWLDGITDSMDMKDREAWCVAAHGATESEMSVTEQQQNLEKLLNKNQHTKT